MLKSLTSLFGLGVDGETVDQRKDRELKELSVKRPSAVFTAQVPS